MSIENEPQPIKNFSEVEQEMKTKGFSYAGLESLTRIAFGDSARFQAVAAQSREDIKQKYSNKDNYEVELITVPKTTENQEAVWVFIKEKE